MQAPDLDRAAHERARRHPARAPSRTLPPPAPASRRASAPPAPSRRRCSPNRTLGPSQPSRAHASPPPPSIEASSESRMSARPPTALRKASAQGRRQESDAPPAGRPTARFDWRQHELTTAPRPATGSQAIRPSLRSGRTAPQARSVPRRDPSRFGRAMGCRIAY